MKTYQLLLFCTAIIVLQEKATTTSTTVSTSTTTSTTITLTLPTIYIQNQSTSDVTLQSITYSYTYSKSNIMYSKETTTSTLLPTNTITSIASSMEIDKSAEKTPEFKGVKSININGSTLEINSRLLGGDPRNPITIDRNSDGTWYIVTESTTPTTAQATSNSK